MLTMPRRRPSIPNLRLSTSFSSCLDSVEALFESDHGTLDADDGDGGEEFVRDGGSEGGIFLVGNHLGDKGVARIVDGLQDPCREYHKLYLCDNRIGRLGASFISFSLKYNTTLLELSLGNNRIGDDGARHIADSLSFNQTLEMLNLEKNDIGPDGVGTLSGSLEHNNHSLQWLVLSENPIGDEGTEHMLQCIGNTSSFDNLQQCNHNLLSIILKKVNVKTTAMRKLQSYLKINRMSMDNTRLAIQRKILMHAKENPIFLLDHLSIRREDEEKQMMHCITNILALLGCQHDLSTSFVVLKNSPHIFSNGPDLEKCIFKA